MRQATTQPIQFENHQTPDPPAAEDADTIYQFAAHWPTPPGTFFSTERVTDVTLDYVAVNDRFADSIPLNGSPLSLAMSNTVGTAEAGEPSPGYGSLLWSWTAPSSARVRVWGERSVWLSQLEWAIFEGDSLSNLRQIAAASAWYPGVHFLARPGAVYRI